MKVQIDRAYPDPKWLPVVQIVVNHVGQGVTQNEASLMLLPSDRNISVELREISSGRGVDQIPFSAALPLGKTFDATLSWTPDGNLSVTLNRAERHSVALGEPVRTIKFTASGAKVAFDNVQFDTAASARQCGGKRSDI